jgi:hypothetical protein
MLYVFGGMVLQSAPRIRPLAVVTSTMVSLANNAAHVATNDSTIPVEPTLRIPPESVFHLILCFY